MHGFRLGSGVAGLRMIGRFARPGELDHVSVRRGQPAVRVHLTGQHVRTLLVGSDDAVRLASTLLEIT